MAQLPEIIPVRDLRQATAAVLKRVRSSGRPVMITRRGRTAAVLLSTDAYERRERERHVLRLLVRSEQEITAGIGYDMNDVLAEADAILARESPA
ncbi:MAG: type II toxin-antitoxin system Phd/YefM family antitoxin [Spirochaetaceae bacterium]|nr:type II toxin-antitoxin system Phd/YefM family antitoxin [Spirochaetaceae bacterium]